MNSSLHLGFEAGRHLWWGRTRQPERNFDRIIDEPLQCSESTDHNDSRSQTLPQSLHAEISRSADGRATDVVVQFGDYGVGGMRDDGTEDTSNVT